MSKEERKPFFDYGYHRRRTAEMMCLACCAVFSAAWIHEVDTIPFIERCPQCGMKTAMPVAGEA